MLTRLTSLPSITYSLYYLLPLFGMGSWRTVLSTYFRQFKLSQHLTPRPHFYQHNRRTPLLSGVSSSVVPQRDFLTGGVRFEWSIHTSCTFKVFSYRALSAQLQYSTELVRQLQLVQAKCVYWSPLFFANEVFALNWPLIYGLNLIPYWEFCLTASTSRDFASKPQVILLQFTRRSSVVGLISDPVAALPWIFALHQLHLLSMSTTSPYASPMHASVVFPISATSLINQYIFLFLTSPVY